MATQAVPFDDHGGLTLVWGAGRAAAYFATGGHGSALVAGAGPDQAAEPDTGPVLGSGVDPHAAGLVDSQLSADR